MPQHGHPRPTAAKRPNEGSGGSKHDPAVRRSNAFVMQIHTAPSQLNCLKPNSTAFAVEAHRKGGSQYIATHWLQGWALPMLGRGTPATWSKGGRGVNLHDEGVRSS